MALFARLVALLLALSPSLALAQVNSHDFSVAAYVKYVLNGNIAIGGNLTVGGAIIDNTNGITLNNPTGGLKGPGTINVAADYYKNGTIIPETVSSPLTLTAGNLACPACVLISGTGHGDSNYQILSTDRYVFINAAFTAPRTWTLPAANSVTVGTTIWVQDALNTITSTNTLTVQRAGADTLNGSGTSTVITGNSGGITFTSDGVSNWGVPEQTVTTGGTGQATLTNHGVLVGAGINPVTQLAVCGTDKPIVGVTAADPACSKLTLTNPATGSTLTIADGKTLTANNTITLASAIDGGVYTFPNTSGSVATISATQTLTNKTIDTAGPNTIKINGVTVSPGQYAATATNDNATAGNVGEYIQSVVLSGSAVPVTSGTQANVTSISLTAGDWDVDGIVYLVPAVTTSVARYVGSLSTTSAILDTNPGKFADFSQPTFVSGGTTFNDVIPPYRFSLSATTTIFLVTLDVFTVSTAGAYGIIRARRVR